jgi:hypothetical protein
VERVARAICADMGQDPDAHHYAGLAGKVLPCWQAFETTARAAIAALPAAGAAMELRKALERLMNADAAGVPNNEWEGAKKQARAALASPPARDATAAAPFGEYARAIEDAAKVAESYGTNIHARELLAAAIRSLAPAPRGEGA